MWRKVLASVLVIGGLILILYPTAHDKYLEYRQQQLIKEWQADLDNLTLTEESESSGQIDKAQDIVNIDLSKEMTGMLIIEKINLKMPILLGVNQRNLSLTAASIENGVRPGENGNYIIAAHRGRTYGVMFNRLNELTEGDKIIIETSDDTYTYYITGVKTVKPTDTEILKNSDKKTITLITCDYSAPKPYLRLIVTGELSNNIIQK